MTTFCRLDELGLEVTGQRLDPDRAVLACRVVEPDQWCRRCGCQGLARDTVVRRPRGRPFGRRAPARAAGVGGRPQERFGWGPTTLVVTICRYRCTGCGHVWRQDPSRAA